MSDAPFRNPAPADSEFVFTFRALGSRVPVNTPGATVRDDRPIHMRATVPAGRTRTAVVVRLEVDGRNEQRVYRPKGLQSDGASVGEWRVPLTSGRHRITVSVAAGEVADAPRQDWSAEIDSLPGRLVVLSFDSTGGFQLEP